jgi:hypothetical protein
LEKSEKKPNGIQKLHSDYTISKFGAGKCKQEGVATVVKSGQCGAGFVNRAVVYFIHQKDSFTHLVRLGLFA